MYGPHLDRVVDRVDNGYKLCVLDLNGRVGVRLRAGITVGFEVWVWVWSSKIK